MTTSKVMFNDALLGMASAIEELSEELRLKIVVIRDIKGIIRVAVNCEHCGSFDELKKIKNAYFDGATGILFRDDLIDPASIFDNPEVSQITIPDTNFSFKFIERMVTGQNWLMKMKTGDVKRIVFYSFKGGVGRTTALTLAAHQLACQGKKVLLIDLDLESPGLTCSLLSELYRPDFGIVDWFVESFVGQEEYVCSNMVTNSPTASELRGKIRVVPAFGSKTGFNYYLPKLSRIFGDHYSAERKIGFSDRLAELINILEKKEKPDVIFIDSRAGVHDLAASCFELSSRLYLFASETDQSWDGYKLILSYWQLYPGIIKNIREQIKMVYSLIPPKGKDDRLKKFVENSYKLFAETIYEEVLPGEDGFDKFNYDIDDGDAPHYPRKIVWSEQFQELKLGNINWSKDMENIVSIGYSDLFEAIMEDISGAKNE